MLKFISLVSVLFLATSFQAVAQDDSAQSLSDFYKMGSTRYTGGYFAPVVKQTTFLDQKSVVAGGRLGVTFYESILAGISGYKLMNDVNREEVDGNDSNFDFSYAGIYVGWNFFPRSIVNFSVLANLGSGATKLTKRDDELDKKVKTVDDVQVIEPEVLAELNLTPHVRMGVGYAYRFLVNRDSEKLSRKDVEDSSIVFSVSLLENLAANNRGG